MTETRPISLVVTRIVQSGREDELRAWSKRTAQSAAQADGFLADLPFEQTGGLFHYVYRFESAQALSAWQASSRYRDLMEEGDRLSTPRRQRRLDGEDAVRLPSEADSPKWKRFLMTWIAVLPVILLVNAALKPLPIPSLVQSAISSFILVAAMTWAILPVVSRRLKPWVVRDAEGQARIDG